MCKRYRKSMQECSRVKHSSLAMQWGSPTYRVNHVGAQAVRYPGQDMSASSKEWAYDLETETLTKLGSVCHTS